MEDHDLKDGALYAKFRHVSREMIRNELNKRVKEAKKKGIFKEKFQALQEVLCNYKDIFCL